ncbi:transposase [uncultured Thiohalocapsa sp.]|uniref:transposase n=1 Tax=uncultured Thiohalocapsa sp. TaxID=768990 RepID=UPI0025E2062D|nr:transposase [uncultured Thiohalocapsa sp.]
MAIFLRQGQRPQELILGGDRHRYLAFRYLACALPDLPWQDWRDSDNIVARLNLPNMRYAPNERVAVYALALRGLVQLEPDPVKRLKYADFVDIYANLTNAEREQYEREYPEETKTMQSFSTRMREEGKQIGIQLGEANVVVYRLEQKFGAIGDETRKRVEQADPDTLLRWSGRVLTEDSIEDVLR